MAEKQTWLEDLDRRVDEQIREARRLAAAAPGAEKQLRLAVKRMAGTPLARLKWVVDFAQMDLALKQPGEKEALGYDLRGLVFHSLGGHPGYTMKLGALSEADLRRYQKTIDAGIRGLLSDPPRAWGFPAEPRVVVLDAAAGTKRQSNRRRFAIRFGGKQDAAVLGGVANLIAEAGEHLRACLKCGKAFVAQMKQARYCSPGCSQSARDKRRG